MTEKRTVTFTTPLAREGCTHVVIYKGKAFLFPNYNEAYSFRKFVVRWLDANSQDETAIVPVAITGDEKLGPGREPV